MSSPSQDEPMYGVRQIAAILDVSPKTVRRLLRDGKLTGRRIGGKWSVLASELKTYLHHHPTNVTKTAIGQVQRLLMEGRRVLLEDMEHFPSYDAARPYQQKNWYYKRCEEMGHDLLQQLPFFVRQDGSVVRIQYAHLGELFNQLMLEWIREYETRTGKVFNKGMVYGNLGVCQIATGKIQEGIASLLNADYQDREHTGLSKNVHNILNGILWQQFERPNVFNYVIQIAGQLASSLRITLDRATLQTLVGRLSLENRLLLESQVWAASRSLRHAAMPHSNIVYRTQLLSALSSVCWMIESLLRDKFGPGTLHPLLCKAVKGKKTGYENSKLQCSASCTREFVGNLRGILATKVSPEERVLCCLRLCRNYTHHQFDPKPSANQDWLSYFEDAFALVLAAMFYLDSIGAL